MKTIEYRVSNRPNKLEVRTTENLKGRGIERISDGSNHKRGLKGYQVTKKALEKLEKYYYLIFVE